MKTLSLTGVLEREGGGFVALCPELDVASQGDSVEQALSTLKEAVDLFLECAPADQVERRYRGEVFVTHLQAAYA